MKKIVIGMAIMSLGLLASQQNMKGCEIEETGEKSRIYICKDKQYVVVYTHSNKQEVKKMTLINQNGNAIVVIGNK